MRWLFHILAAAATAAYLGLDGLMVGLLLSASAPGAALAASLLKLVGLTLFFGLAGICVWLWMRRNWAILVVPLLGLALQVAIVEAGNELLSWTIRFGPAP
jgi:uncharacterized membrane protein